MNFDIANTLQATLSADRNIRQQAENSLGDLEKRDFNQYITLLLRELSDESKPLQTVQMAGIMLKNAVDAKNEELSRSLRTRWLGIPDAERTAIHQQILQLLNSQNQITRETSSLVIAKLAAVEMPAGFWLDLPSSLSSSAMSAQSEGTRCCAFKAIGYMCEELSSLMEGHAHMLYQLICQTLGNAGISDALKLDALKTLYSCLNLGKNVFGNNDKREFVLKIVFNFASTGNDEIRMACFNCLTSYSDLYYDYLNEIMIMIINLSKETLENQNVSLPVKHHAIEFWSNLAEVETKLSNSNGKASQNLLARSLSCIAPVLLNKLIKTNEDDFDDESINESSASGTCIHLIAICTKDELVDYVEPFLQKNIDNSDWKMQEAALCAFGLLLEGPSQHRMQSMVSGAFPGVIVFCESQNKLIRETATWALARICKGYAVHVREFTQLHKLLGTMLKDHSKMAANACWAIHSLAESVQGDYENSNGFFSSYEHLVGQLVGTLGRQDGKENKLFSKVFETLNALVLAAPQNKFNIVEQLLDHVLSLLNQSLNNMRQNQLTNINSAEINNIHSNTISTISTITKVLPVQTLQPRIDNIMQTLTSVLESNDKTIYEEVLIGIGVIINKMGENFEPYINNTLQFVYNGLEMNLGSVVYQASVGVIGDIYRVMGVKLCTMGISDVIFCNLCQSVEATRNEYELFPHIANCMADIAISLGLNFRPYFQVGFKIVISLSSLKADLSYHDSRVFFYSYWKSLLDCYTLILHSTGEDNTMKSCFLSVAPLTFNLLEDIADNKVNHPDTLAAAISYIGDLNEVLGTNAATVVNTHVTNRLLELASNVNDAKLQRATEWLRQNNSITPNASSSLFS